jgi:hypothetical protein
MSAKLLTDRLAMVAQSAGFELEYLPLVESQIECPQLIINNPRNEYEWVSVYIEDGAGNLRVFSSVEGISLRHWTQTTITALMKEET